MKILLAEDDHVTRQILARALQKLGHEVVATSNGREAWAAFQRENVSLLISDRFMPEMDGLELCRLIRTLNRKKYTYVIFLTIAKSKAGFLAAMDAGADDYLTKPLDEEELVARLRVAQRILRLQEEMKQLRIRTCCYCRRMLNEDGHWVPADPSVERYRNVALTHGICPACWEKHVKPELDLLVEDDREPA